MNKAELTELQALIAKRLRVARRARGFTQTWLGGLVFRSQNTIAGYEKGARTPDIYSLIALAKALQVSLDYLVGQDAIDKAVEELEIER
jgi:transcriptional regulator with XRE-family HTH domain